MKRFIFTACLLFIFASCKKEKTSWNSDWVLPLISDTLSLENLENDSTINSNSSSYYSVDLTRTIFDLGIEDLIQIPDTVIQHAYNISAGSLSLPPGTSIVNEIEEHEIKVEPIELKKIRVSTGTIKLKVSNPIGTKAFFTVQLPGVSKNGVNFSEQFTAPAGSISNPGVVDATLDISGYYLDLTGSSGSSFNLLQSKLLVVSDPTGPTVTISSAHQFKVDAEFKDIKIDYARGYFGNKENSDTTSTNLDFLSMISSGTLDIPSPSIQFIIENGLKASAKAVFTKVSNTNYQGNTVNLNSSLIGSPVYIDPATGSWASLVRSTETVSFNSLNSNIEAYIENLGTTHEIGYKIELNPWGNTSGGWNEIFPDSRLKVKIKAQMSLSLGADALTLKDTFDLDVSQDLEKSHIESGVFVLNASNTFPLSSAVKLYLLDENGNVLHEVIGTSDILSSLEGALDSEEGLMKKNSELLFDIPDNILIDLKDIRKIIVETRFDSPDPSTGNNVQVMIPAGAYLAVKLKAKLNIKAKV